MPPWPPVELQLSHKQTLSRETAGSTGKETVTGNGQPGSEAFNLSDPQPVHLYNQDVNDSAVALADEVQQVLRYCHFPCNIDEML